jgi:replicative DNA helicase
MTPLTHQHAIIGAILIDGQPALSMILQAGVTADWFSDKLCNTVFRTSQALYGLGNPLSMTSILNRMASKGHDTTLDEQKAIIEAADQAPPLQHLLYHAEQLDNERKLHGLKRMSVELAAKCENGTTDSTPEIIHSAITSLTELSTGIRQQEPIADCAERVLDEWDKPQATGQIGWHLEGLRHALDGLSNELVYIAARESVGKTAFALNMAIYNAKRSHPVSLASLESSRERIAPRILSIISGIDARAYRKRDTIGSDDARAYRDAVDTLRGLPFRVVDSPMDTERLHAWARCEVDAGAKLIIVDNMRHIRMAGKFGAEHERHAALSLRLKEIRDDIGKPLVVLHHLSKGMDVAWSDTIRRDVDILLFLIRNDELSREPQVDEIEGQMIPGRDIVDIEIQKNRDGVSGIMLRSEFDKPIQVFRPYSDGSTERREYGQ